MTALPGSPRFHDLLARMNERGKFPDRSVPGWGRRPGANGPPQRSKEPRVASNSDVNWRLVLAAFAAMIAIAWLAQ